MYKNIFPFNIGVSMLPKVLMKRDSALKILSAEIKWSPEILPHVAISTLLLPAS